MSWIASTSEERRAQLGRFLLGTGGIGGIAGATGPGLGLSEEEGLRLIDRAVAEGMTVLDTADVYTGGTSERVVATTVRPCRFASTTRARPTDEVAPRTSSVSPLAGRTPTASEPQAVCSISGTAPSCSQGRSLSKAITWVAGTWTYSA